MWGDASYLCSSTLACHKLYPSGGQGANQAIMSAVSLANLLYQLPSNRLEDVETCFHTYRAQRRFQVWFASVLTKVCTYIFSGKVNYTKRHKIGRRKERRKKRCANAKKKGCTHTTKCKITLNWSPSSTYVNIVTVRQADTISDLEQGAELDGQTGQQLCGTRSPTGRVPALCQRWR